MTKKDTAPGFGIGVDIEQVDRFKKFSYDTRDAFLRRVYTPAELRYCFSKKNSAEHLAARFAAKEAVMKAVAGVGKKQPAFRSIDIRKKKNGMPVAVVAGLSKKIQIALSLSHTAETAIAFAVATYAD